MSQTRSEADHHHPLLYLSLTDAKAIGPLDCLESLSAANCLNALHADLSCYPNDLSGRPISGIQFGNEFCERLLPTQRDVSRITDWCQSRNLTFSFATPMLADKGIAQLAKLLGLLPAQCEVVCNDFGVLRLVTQGFHGLQPVAGRQLCKMIKDPRLPSADWAKAIPPGLQSSLFVRMLHRFNISSLETDVRPFADTTDFEPNGLDLSVHIPFGYTLKGRICRPGSLHLSKQKKFTPGHSCQKECLSYFGKMERTGKQSPHELKAFTRGNSIFYHYADEQQRVLKHAINKGWVKRLILAGDWHENRRSH